MDSERKARYEQLYNIKLTEFYNFVSEVMGDFNYSIHRTVKDIENKRRIEIWAYQSREDQSAVVWIEVVKPGEVLDPYITTDVLRTMNDENVIGGAVKGGVSGAAGGGLTGSAAGYAGRAIDGFGLTHHKPFEIMTKGEYNQYGRNGKKYYKDYIQNTTVNNDILGDIIFTGAQAGKPDYRYMEQYPVLKQNIKISPNLIKKAIWRYLLLIIMQKNWVI